MNKKLTQDQALDLFRYDPETGYLHWRVDVGYKIKSGHRAGSLHSRGYIDVRFNGRVYRAHRVRNECGPDSRRGEHYSLQGRRIAMRGLYTY
jgi:hypothetical protein